LKTITHEFHYDDGSLCLIIRHESFNLSNRGFLISEISTARREHIDALKQILEQPIELETAYDLRQLNIIIVEKKIRKSSSKINLKIHFSGNLLEEIRLGATAIINILEQKIATELALPR